MLMHGEIKWLFAYLVILAAAVTASVAASWKAGKSTALAVLGLPAVLVGWLWQVGRFG